MTKSDRYSYIKNRKTQCWNWTGKISKDGYARVDLFHKSVLAHRLAALICIGLPPIGKLNVLHSCDNKRCVNPKHLRWGTQNENVKDAIERGLFQISGHANKKKIVCPKGHKYDGTRKNGNRFCRICVNENWRVNYWKKHKPHP